MPDYSVYEGTHTGAQIDSLLNKINSSETYTSAEKSKLAGLENYDDTDIQAAIAGKVDKDAGKGLSTEDYTTAEKTKLAGLENYDDTDIQAELSTIANSASKNLVPNTAATSTLNGVTFTVNDDKSVTVDGTASANTTFAIVSDFSLPVGEYILSGCPTGGTNASYLLQMRNDTTQQNVAWQTSGNETPFTLGDATRRFIVVIRIAKDYTASNVVFKPMIRKAAITDSTYQPYSPTSSDMWAEIQRINGDDCYYVYDKDEKKLSVDSPKFHFVFMQREDSTIRLNAWRLYKGDLKIGGTLYNLWINSDAEGVIKLSGEDDHLSGYHGDELNGTAQILIDGKELNLTKNSQGKYKTITCKCTSDIYHCNTSANADTKAFTRLKEVELYPDGYKVRQKWTATDAVTIARGAQALLQCYKSQNDKTILYGMDADDIYTLQSTDFNDSTITLASTTIHASMYTIAGKLTLTALKGYDNQYYAPSIRDFDSQNRDKIYFDMFNGKALAVGDSIETAFEVKLM